MKRTTWQRMVLKVLAVLALVVGSVWLLKTALTPPQQAQTTSANYQRWQRQVSPLPLRTTAMALQVSQHQPTATIIYNPSCKVCQQLARQLTNTSTTTARHPAHVPFNVVAMAHLRPDSHLWPNQLNIGHTPALVVWWHQQPQLVIVQPTPAQVQQTLQHYRQPTTLPAGSYNYINNVTHTTSIANCGEHFVLRNS